MPKLHASCITVPHIDRAIWVPMNEPTPRHDSAAGSRNKIDTAEDTRSIKGKSVPINNNTKRKIFPKRGRKERTTLYTLAWTTFLYRYTRLPCLDYIFISVFSVFNDTKIPEYSASILYSSPKLHILEIAYLIPKNRNAVFLRITNILYSNYNIFLVLR